MYMRAEVPQMREADQQHQVYLAFLPLAGFLRVGKKKAEKRKRSAPGRPSRATAGANPSALLQQPSSSPPSPPPPARAAGQSPRGAGGGGTSSSRALGRPRGAVGLGGGAVMVSVASSGDTAAARARLPPAGAPGAMAAARVGAAAPGHGGARLRPDLGLMRARRASGGSGPASPWPRPPERLTLGMHVSALPGFRAALRARPGGRPAVVHGGDTQ